VTHCETDDCFDEAVDRGIEGLDDCVLILKKKIKLSMYQNCFLSGASKVLIVFYLELQRYELFSIWNFKGMNYFLSEASKV
jgi:hypothetical protein